MNTREQAGFIVVGIKSVCIQVKPLLSEVLGWYMYPGRMGKNKLYGIEIGAKRVEVGKKEK